MKKKRTVILSIACIALVLIGVKLFLSRQPASVRAVETSDVLYLHGAIRDFRSSHADFGITDTSAMGHCVHSIHPELLSGTYPEYSGFGLAVTAQWYDKDLNPIMPYASDPGLAGGHFDVDVFDGPSDKELYHEHEFDDKFDVTYVDIAGDPKLLFDEVIGSDYPNDLRVEFFNAHHGSGMYTFQAGGLPLTGKTKDGFETTFSPSMLTTFRIDFALLLDLRGTQPSKVQDDIVKRDDSLSIRMYDVTTDDLVYELAVYHHVKSGDSEPTITVITGGEDACGNDINDTAGTYGSLCNGGITNSATYHDWFRDVLGVNLSQLLTIQLKRNSLGIYEYLTDEFYPIDRQLLGNEYQSHNNLFTYAIPATFEYRACTGQFFEFEGNDDAWVFIDNKMVIDLGGLATPERQFIALDRLDLVDGQTYSFNFFYAHRRHALESVFRMRTNILLMSDRDIQISGAYD